MQSQKQLVDIVGKFTPKIVKMDGAKHKTWGKKRDEVVGE
jgi:tRNA-splicing ligase RtcB